jgi:hypothetical protein
MPSCSEIITRSRFERRHPGGRYDLVFKVAFGSYAVAARALGVSKMTIWRWRHARSSIPEWILGCLERPVQKRAEQASEAKNQLRYLLALPPKPVRPLSGCCARRHRKVRKMPVTAADWAALGD